MRILVRPQKPKHLYECFDCHATWVYYYKTRCVVCGSDNVEQMS